MFKIAAILAAAKLLVAAPAAAITSGKRAAVE